MLLLCAALLGTMTARLAFADPETLAARDRLGEPPATAALVHAYRQLPPVAPPAWKNLETRWSFALGDPAEGLNTGLDRLPERREPTPLPHRILHADTPYWYAAEVRLTTPTALEIRADDGAQLFADGKRIPIRGDYFFVPAASRLVVRVLNKALYGGLVSVSIAPQPEVERYLRETRARERLDALVRKTRLLRAPTVAQVEAAHAAVRLRSDEAIGAAEKRLAALPLSVVGPYLQDAAPDHLRIVWETDVPCNAALDWGEGYALDRHADAKSDGNLHVATLESLRPGATYSYRLRSGGVASPVHTFRTLPADGPVEFTAWGDVQNSWRVFRQNVHAMRQLPIAFTVGVGDLVENAHHRAPWQGFFEALAPLAAETPVMLVGGNHDYDGCFEDLHSVYFERYARSQPTSQYFAWTAGNARFVALDPNTSFPTGIPQDSAQYRWLLRELESPAWKQATWHFLFIHQPPYSQGWAEYHGDLPIRDMLTPLLEKYGIDFIVSGHTHDYERWTLVNGSQKTHLFIVGGGGSGLEDEAMSAEPVMDKVIRRHHFGRFRIEGRKVTVEAVATDTRVLDRFEASK